MQKIQFFDYDRNSNLRNKKRLKAYVGDIFLKEKRTPNNVSYIFCSDNQLLKINNKFLKHDYYTDVICFDLSESPKRIDAEIYISIDRVRDNATKEGVSFREELHRVVFHGTLHLCGYNDKKKEEVARMRKRENKYLNEYFK